MDQDEARAEDIGSGTQAGQTGQAGLVSGDDGPGTTAPHDPGMATAEYAVATLAAVGFAGLLFAVLRSGEVQELLLDLVRRALTTV